MQIFHKEPLNNFLPFFLFIFLNVVFYTIYVIWQIDSLEIYTYFSLTFFLFFMLFLKANSLTSILFILYFNFIFVILKYVNGGGISVYTTFQEEKYVFEFLFLLNIYSSFTYLLFSSFDIKNIVIPRYKSNFFYFLYLCCILFVYFGISGPSLITAPYHVVSTSKNSLFEYALVFFPFLYVFINTNFKKNLFILLIFIYVLISLLYGARIEVFGLFLFYIFFMSNFGSKKSFLLFLFLNYLAIVFSNIRTNPLLLTSFHTFSDIFNLSSLSTFEDLTHSSLRLLFLNDYNLISYSFLIENLLSAFTFLYSFYDLSIYLQSDYISGGGGLIFTHLVNYFPYLHSFIYITFLFIFLIYFRKSFFLISIFIIFFPRLFLYYPFFFIKVLYFTIFLVIVLRCFFVNYQCK